MDQSLVQALLERQAKRREREPEDTAASVARDNIVSAMMPHQRALYFSVSKRDAVIAPRQTGKSWSVLLLIFAYCVARPGQRWVLIGPTLESLDRIYMEAFGKINTTFGLNIKFNHSSHKFVFPNGSNVVFMGASQDGAADKLRGGTYDGVVVDEAQYYPLGEFDYLLQDVIERALDVKKGRLIIVGTPGEVLQGEFYIATCSPAVSLAEGVMSNYFIGSGKEGDGLWCKHVWTPQSNIAEPHLWEAALATKKKRGWTDSTPKWRREYLGEWVPTHDVLVYTLKSYMAASGGNLYTELPELGQNQEPWRYVLGVDLGSKDGTAMVVWAYSKDHPNMYEVYSHKEYRTEEQRITAGFLARWRKQLLDQFGSFEEEVCDPGGLADLMLGTLSDEHGVHWEPAEVRKKEDHIQLFNDDLEERRLFLRAGGELAIEMASNRWLKDRKTGFVLPVGQRKEDPRTPNDLCDAALYAFRWCYHRFFRPKATVTVSALQAVYNSEREAYYNRITERIRDLEDPCRILN